MALNQQCWHLVLQGFQTLDLLQGLQILDLCYKGCKVAGMFWLPVHLPVRL